MQIDFFHIGPQKSGTTWIYESIKQHSQICAPSKDTIHFFDLHYHKDQDWLNSWFNCTNNDQLIYDPTPSYIRSTVAPERIYQHNPKAKIALTLREPIERAFSHYWHEKKKLRYNFSFAEVLQNYDLFCNWIEPGFYATHIERYLRYFPREQLLCQDFSLLRHEPEKFLHELLRFLEIDTDFSPPTIGGRVNPAGYKINFLGRAGRRLKGIKKRGGVLGTITTPLANTAIYLNEQYNLETLDRVDPAVLRELAAICEPETKRLEALLDIDLSHWRRYV